MELDFSAFGFPAAEDILPGAQSFLSMRFVAGALIFIGGITLTTWMVAAIRNGLALRIISVRGRRANQTEWCDEEDRPHRLWYVGRTVGAWVGSALGNPFAIWPKGWTQEDMQRHRDAEREMTQATRERRAPDPGAFKTATSTRREMDAARDVAIARYRGWLKDEIRRGQAGGKSQAFAELKEIQYEVKGGGAVAIACWCRPDPCHGDVVADAVAYLELAEMDDDELERRFGKRLARAEETPPAPGRLGPNARVGASDEGEARLKKDWERFGKSPEQIRAEREDRELEGKIERTRKRIEQDRRARAD